MKYFYFLMILLSISSFAQQRNEYKVRLMAKEVRAFPLKITNTTTNESVVSDSGGFFNMKLAVNDELVLNENAFYQLKYHIRAKDLQENVVRIYLEPINTELETIEVEKITAKSLGVDAETIRNNTINQNPNLNMNFAALFMWLVKKVSKKRSDVIVVARGKNEMNPYVASLPRTVITDYLKIPDELVEKFYYFMNTDYMIDLYIKEGDEAKWRMHLLDKSFEFLENEKSASNR